MIGGALSIAYNYRRENNLLQEELEALKVQLYEECIFRIQPDI